QPSWKDNSEIKDLRKTAEDQKKEIETLQENIATSQLALAQEEVATLKLTKDATLQAQKVRDREIMVNHLKRELKEKKESVEWMTDKKKEKAAIGECSFTYLYDGLEYRKILSQKKKELKTIQEQHKAEKQSLLAQIESCKAECRKRRRIIEVNIDQLIVSLLLKKQIYTELMLLNNVLNCLTYFLFKADKEMKVTLGGTIEFLRQKNAFLLRELTSGFVGKYRIARQFFGAVLGAIRARFH
ncbi:unnamed protein product, partial [Pocillopora meandrina]